MNSVVLIRSSVVLCAQTVSPHIRYFLVPHTDPEEPKKEEPAPVPVPPEAEKSEEQTVGVGDSGEQMDTS